MTDLEHPLPPPPTLEPGSSSRSVVISHLHHLSAAKSSPLGALRRLKPFRVANPKGKERENGIGLAEEDQVEHTLGDRIAARIQRLRGNTDSKSEDDTETEGFSVSFKDKRSNPGEEVYDRDTFKWAVMYENQRGLTLLGQTRYSPSTLLPNDPPPFTILLEPGVNDPNAMITPHTLNDFQLPDSTWMWVSRRWLVQMGGNGSSHDGFEYNWCFREKGWRSYPGRLGSGGWVRRRRWIRLMMRPGDPEFAPAPSGGGSLRDHMSSWTGDLENDVAYCRRILGRLGTDGKRITMWRRWLNVDEHHSKANGKSSSEDDEANPGIPSASGSRGEDLEERIPKEWAVAIIRCYTQIILRSFIYPESRARFIRMLQGNGLDSKELQRELEMDFWSIAHL